MSDTPGMPPPPPSSPQPNYTSVGTVREYPGGSTILVLGILSLVICGILGPFAWSMGNKAIKAIDSDRGTTYTNRGAINAGRICGIISTCLLALGVVVLIIIAAGSS